MTPNEVGPLVALAVELFPRTTDARFGLLRTMLVAFPDPKFARETLTAQATRTNDLDLPAVRETLDRETARRSGRTVDREAIKAREAALLAARQQRNVQNDEIDAVVLAMDDAELDRLKAEAIRTFPDRVNGAPSDAARDLLARMNPRKCFPLRVEIYRVLDSVGGVA